MNNHQTFNIRVTGVLVEDNRLLLVQQRVDAHRDWSLPGGRVEAGETLETAMVREMKEETGLTVRCGKLLYVCEKPETDPPILHVTFLLDRLSGDIVLPTNEQDENPISDVKYVPVDDLASVGFSSLFMRLVKTGFPDAGSYRGAKSNIGL